MKTSYDEFVHSVEDTSSFEKKLDIKKHELTRIRNCLKSDDIPGRPRLVAKLIYLEMEGESTQFGQIEVANLMAQSNYNFKWLGYIGSSVLTDATSEVLLLMTHTILKDISHEEQPNVQVLALSAVANIGGNDLITASLQLVQKEMTSKTIRVAKAAACAALRAVRENPEYIEAFRKYVPELLNHKSHCVMIAGINLACEMLTRDPHMRTKWKLFGQPFMNVLRDLKHNAPTKKTEFHFFNDPFLQCRALKALGLLKHKSDELDSLLQEIITDLDCHTNTARSILLEATETVKLSGKSHSLKVLAINQIGRMLDLKSAAVLYSALSAFSRLLLSENDIIDRNSSDSTAMQRYRGQIVKLLDHPDLSIRKRALEVISAILNENNITKLAPEIIRYMKLVDTEFRSEMVPKIYTAVQRFSPDNSWNIDSTLHIIIDNAKFIGNDIISSFCTLVSKNNDLRSVALESLENILTYYQTNQPLMQISAFLIGEFENNKPDVIDKFMKVIVQPNQLSRTTCYIIVALAKLAFRFQRETEIFQFLSKFENDNRLDVQQRAGEMKRLLSNPKYSVFLKQVGDNLEESNNQPYQQSSNSKPQINDLLDIDDKEDIHIQKSSKKSSQDALLDLMDDSDDQNTRLPKLPKDAKLAFETSDFSAYFEVQVNKCDVRQVAIRVSFFNKTNVQLNKFNPSFGVPDGWSLTAQPISSTSLPPQGGPPITQVLLLMNHGSFPLAMRAQINYMFRSQPISEKCLVNNVFK